MAKRKETEGTGDSLEGTAPLQDEAEKKASASEVEQSQQMSGDGNEVPPLQGVATIATDQEGDALSEAIARIAGREAPVWLNPSKIVILRRFYTVTQPILHDGEGYGPGDLIALTEDEAAPLLRGQCLADAPDEADGSQEADPAK